MCAAVALAEAAAVVGSAAAATAPTPVGLVLGLGGIALVAALGVVGLIYSVTASNDTTTPDPPPPFEGELRQPDGTRRNVSYRCARQLGDGGFSAVSLGTNWHDSVAIKRVRPHTDYQLRATEREIECLTALTHPFIVRFRGHIPPAQNDNDGYYLLFLDYIPGGTLREAIKTNPKWFTFRTVKAKIICGIALAMEHIHSKNIIHRDLKAENVLLDSDHLPKICDFGSSRKMDGNNLSGCPSVTPRYEAPELLEQVYNEDGHYTNKIDVYSFGVLLYEIVAGKLAFHTDGKELTQLQLMNRIDRGEREPFPEDITPTARYLIEKCWAKDPNDRPTFREICDILRCKCGLLFPGQNPKKMNSFVKKYWKKN